MRRDSSFLGLVRRVVGSKVTVEVTPDLPSVSPVIDGRVHRVGQVGSFVRIPVGLFNLFGVVTVIGSTELRTSDDPVLEGRAQRWLEVQLIGESLGTEKFERGVSTFPTLDDEVHILTGEYASLILGTKSKATVPIGTHVASSNLPAHLDVNKAVSRHTCIVGATGSGKSNTVAVLLTQFAQANFPSAQIVVIDPHGEYASAFPDTAKVFRIGHPSNPLVIPHWVLTFDEITALLFDRRAGSEMPQEIAIRDRIFTMKKEKVGVLKAGKLSPEDITVDAPVPYDLRQLWYYFDRAERATYDDGQKTKEALEEEGDAASLKPVKFKPHSTTNSPPYKGTPPVANMAPYINRLFNRLRDARFDFLLRCGDHDGEQKDLGDLLQDWLGHDRPITVFDVSNAPHEVVDLAIGAISRVLFDASFWGRVTPGIGRDRPLVIVYEEAHMYLSKQGTPQGYAKRAAQRIMKEGRKYGVGAFIVSQRPSEVDDTVLSQCGTFVAMRLTNGSDQGQIKSTVPDAMAGMLELLPALRTGEALVMGEAVEFPYRVKVDLLPNRPDSQDPVVNERWGQQRSTTEYDRVVTGWRAQRLPQPATGNTGG